MIRIAVSHTVPEQAALERAAEVIRDGGVVALPTDTLYGLAVDAHNEHAVRRLFDVKGRDIGRALPVIAWGVAQVVSELGPLSPLGRSLVERFWPGPLTLIVHAPEDLNQIVGGGTGGVGVRVPAHPVARALCRTCQRLLTATSANRSGRPPSADPDEIDRTLQGVDVLLDAGPAPGGPPSTVVDIRGDMPVLVRAGAIPWAHILASAEAHDST
jgi:L-threonylcarbamoyladenylate synthase